MNKTHKISDFNSFILNFLRIMGAWFVLFGHSFSYYQLTIFKDQKYFAYIQNIGVVILFVISGFFSAYSMKNKNDKGDYSFISYFIERFCRIYLVYIPALIFVFIVDKINLHFNNLNYIYLNSFNIKTFLANILMLQNYPASDYINFYATCFGSARPLWTLSIEWGIYLTFGYFILVVKKNMIKNNSIKITNLIILTLLGWSSMTFLVGEAANVLIYTWCFGLIIFYLYNKIIFLLRIKHFFILISILCIFLFILVCCKFKDVYRLDAILILSFSILFLLAWGKEKKISININKIGCFFASYTYSLYLVHYSIIDLIFRTQVSIPKSSKFWCGIIISNLVAISFSIMFEKRSHIIANKIKKYYNKIRTHSRV